VISETRFIKSYNSLWRNLAPTMELFVRKANLHLYNRNWLELPSTSAPEARSLINQVAFQSLIQAVTECASYDARVGYIEDVENTAAVARRFSSERLLNELELRESSVLAKRMCAHLFHLRRDHVRLNPRFEGCGLINACYGDAISDGDQIIEFKDGDRPFRSYEFRQMTIYGALHLNSTGRLPPSFVVINSRRGVSVEMSTDQLAEEVAGQSGYDYLREVVRVISDVTISI
jgi:hypothetical protein